MRDLHGGDMVLQVGGDGRAGVAAVLGDGGCVGCGIGAVMGLLGEALLAREAGRGGVAPPIEPARPWNWPVPG
jgi:hypothetical protein